MTPDIVYILLIGSMPIRISHLSSDSKHRSFRDLLQYQKLARREREKSYTNDFGQRGVKKVLSRWSPFSEAIVGTVNYCLGDFYVVDGPLLVFNIGAASPEIRSHSGS
jgi:hypothetical protein